MTKDQALKWVNVKHHEYRATQEDAHAAREAFIDALEDAKAAKATQEEMAAECTTQEGPLSRQRIAQFLKERRSV